jgi:single-strand selective monofunctional uracil DNA glycosylase
MQHSIADNIIDTMIRELDALTFSAPVASVYNPLTYARESYRLYWQQYASSPKEIILLGMNPGPWGMVQTGIPFGDVQLVKHWLKLQAPINAPAKQHPKRPILGFKCRRSEVSGRRLWGWAKERFHTPKRFFSRFWVANYCPLAFMENTGRNRTPDKLPRFEKAPLFEICDKALKRTIEVLKPRFVIGVGGFAAQRAQAALTDMGIALGRITHPSPANPRANRGWARYIESELKDIGISV